MPEGEYRNGAEPTGSLSGESPRVLPSPTVARAPIGAGGTSLNSAWGRHWARPLTRRRAPHCRSVRLSQHRHKTDYRRSRPAARVFGSLQRLRRLAPFGSRPAATEGCAAARKGRLIADPVGRATATTVQELRREDRADRLTAKTGTGERRCSGEFGLVERSEPALAADPGIDAAVGRRRGGW